MPMLPGTETVTSVVPTILLGKLLCIRRLEQVLKYTAQLG